ncbi:MAG: Gfo/Idh/MocA family oxidoreductase [Bacteroidota bacterium]
MPTAHHSFALIGAAGYVAPRHMQAMRDTGHTLVAALDPCDSVGVLDQYFPDTHFFTEFERFDRHVDKRRRKGAGIDYVSICSPNYLHDAHVRFALRSQAHAICEKPLVLNPWNLEALAEIEQETDRHLYTILQLRLHPAVRALRERVQQGPPDRVYDVELTYLTSRGRWYFISWKGDQAKSGGVATNIGIHFFDMLSWVFGPVQGSAIHLREPGTMAGLLHLERARVRWFLSVDAQHLPTEVRAQGQRTYRALTIEDEAFEFSGGFTDLHTRSYEEILAGRGFGLEAARPSIQTVHTLRHEPPVSPRGDVHPLVQRRTTAVSTSLELN